MIYRVAMLSIYISPFNLQCSIQTHYSPEYLKFTKQNLQSVGIQL